ncbi:MMS19 nucleotide excision repair protein homolog [Acanthaster planci]|uniref:MMS19 nucleotide excision repair protein n=1 Tax=Acanthaster planci TaxID=133434 RepID=A0A8B7XLB4_ACAPL|nr:MMS19 nucleotide excision repair protein homolog [Acanthaster planci]XP_022080750.1 MMS19 nucleotide excision repair protein homolog [Acanthaster planci]
MAAPIWTESLENFIRGEQDSGITTIVSGVNNGDITLLKLVEMLGPYLTSKESNIRGRGTLLLAEILHRLPRDKLSAEETGLLAAFFCDRLKDHHSITPHAIYGLLSLSICTSLPAGDAAKICLNLFKEVRVQTLVQADRQSVFSIISNFLYSRLEELRELGSEFVYGFIQAMDREKDPRNLVMAFQTVQTLIDHFPINIFAEELFEVTSCYFPIDFRPPPNDPHGITTEMLVAGLRSCLAATPKFAEFCLPLLMEKLSSELQGAKLDAFETLAACSPVYGAKHLKDYLEAVWSYCRKDVFQSFSQEVEQAALGCLCCVVKAVSDDKTEEGAMFSLDCFLDDILKESQKHINEPDMRFIHPSCRLLQAVASSSEAVCSKVLAYTLPLLLDQFGKHLQAKQRQSILSILQAFVRVSLAFPYTDFPNPVSLHKDALLSVLLSVLSETNTSLKSVSAAGLSVLVETKGLLEEDDVVLVAEHMTKTFLIDVNEDLRQDCVNALTHIATHYPSLTAEKVLPAFLEQLKTEQMEVEAEGDNQTVPHISHHALLSSMAALATQPTLVECIVDRLLVHLQSLSNGDATSKAEECIWTCKSILAIVANSRTDPTNLSFFHRKLLPEILWMSLKAALEPRSSEVDTSQLLCREEVIVLLAAIVRNVVQCLESSLASELCQQYIEVFHQQNLNKVSSIGSTENSELDAVFKPLEIGSPWPQSQLVVLLTACICSVRRGVTIPNESELLPSLLALSTGSDHELTATTAAKCLAGLLNKFGAGPELDQLIEMCKQHLLPRLQSSSAGETRQRSLTCWIWLTKAFLLRSHPSCNDLASRLVSLFEDDTLGSSSAQGLFVILSDSEDVLHPSSHADVKLMYRQRLFLQLLPGIIEGHCKTAQGTKKNYLLSLSHLLHFVPRQVLLSELPPLMPLLVQSLHQEDSALYESVLERLALLTHDAPGIISQYVDSLLPDLLRLSGCEASMKVRVGALKCIGELTTLEHHKVFPHKLKVARGLIPRLDDKKRVVRKEAVKARNLWMMLGSPKK